MIPAGLINNDIEAYAVDGRVKVLRNGQITDLTDSIDTLTAFRSLMEAEPDVLTALDYITDPIEQITRFVSCRFGNFDLRADLTAEGVAIPEHWNCPERGSCPDEGILCKLPAGLTRRELQVVALTARGMCNKQIADVLSISVLTVAQHMRHIEVKLHADSKLDIVRFAIENNIEP